jgi:DNA-binding NarL/FixJ family response regulator
MCCLPSETRILRSIADGLSNKEIGVKLSLTEEAVKGQVKSILVETRCSRSDARGCHWHQGGIIEP